jgi:hypothetical protein
VNLSACWLAGQQKAALILQRGELFSAEEVDFAAIALAEPGTNLLRPRGELVGHTEAE